MKVQRRNLPTHLAYPRYSASLPVCKLLTDSVPVILNDNDRIGLKWAVWNHVLKSRPEVPKGSRFWNLVPNFWNPTPGLWNFGRG